MDAKKINRFVSAQSAILIRATAAFCITALSQAQVNILTSNYDNQRTNSNLHETVLNPRGVNSTSFGKIGTFPVDAIIYAQPLYVSNVQVTGLGKRNVVYLATMHNSVYAIDADAPQSTTPLWMVNLGPSIPSSVFNFSDIVPEVGILSTPVIDLSRSVIYVVSDTLESGAPVFRLHALSLSDGSEKMNGPVLVTASVPGTSADSAGGVLQFNASLHLQRPGLALAGGTVYVAFGSHGDLGLWHGWLMGFDASNLQNMVTVFNASPNGQGASIWQAGRGPAIDDRGDMFVVTGNGDYDGSSAYGESVLHLSSFPSQARRRDGKLNLLDWFTPAEWSELNDNDYDLGSTGVILVPNTNLLLAGSKAGMLYLIPTDSMGHLQSASSSVQAVQANQWGMFDMALWAKQQGPIVYVSEPFQSVKAFQIANGRINSTALSEFPISSFFVGLAVSADGGADGTGVVWLTTADYSTSGLPGTLHALDASDLSNELWNSNMQADRDGLGRFAKFVAPTVANGRVYVPTFSNALVIYGLLSSVQQSTTPPQVTAVVNGASFLGNAVSPGEVVAIFGANLGASALTQMQLNANGQVSTSLAGTEVLFDSVPAPVLYTSATQVGAIAPFGLSSSTTKIQVAYNGQTSAAAITPVVPAMPSVFSQDGTGGGFGILNQDGSVNTSVNMAAVGTMITFYATGGGLTVPASSDGAVTNSSPYPVPILPVTALIDGQNAQVVYAGAAPGMPAGVLQVNALVPTTVYGYNLQVLLSVGGSPSLNSLQVNVQ